MAKAGILIFLATRVSLRAKARFYLHSVITHISVFEGYGGPCGVLAAVQAELLVQCLFRDGNVEIDESSIKLEECRLQKAFAAALATIIERAKVGASSAVVELTANVTADLQYLESSHFRIIVFPSFESLASYLGNHTQMFFSNVGCLLFIMSLVFTRGVDTVVSDMDSTEHTLIGN